MRRTTLSTASEPRVRDAMLIALTFSTGAVDAISFLGLGKVFSAFMTGNFVFLGLRIGGAGGAPVPRVLASLAAFSIGAFLAAWTVKSTEHPGVIWPRRVTAALCIGLVSQSTFLILWLAVSGPPSNVTADVLIALSAFAMGLQTVAVFSLGVRAVFTTATTATLAVLMGDLSGWSQSRGERRRLAMVILAVLAGAVIGGVLMVHARDWAAAFPPVVTAAVIATSMLFSPRAPEARQTAAAPAEARP